MTPLRIDFQIAGLMAVPDGLPTMLDATLLSLHAQGLQLPSLNPTLLPLEHYCHADSWHWLASCIFVNYCGPSSARFIYRNPRPTDLLEHASQHNASRAYLDRGMTRTVRNRILVRQATSAVAWCIGEPDKLQSLLSNLAHLGGMRHMGFGQVTDFTIKEDSAALENAWLRPINTPTKADPFASERIALQGQSHPPYWMRSTGTALWPLSVVA